MDLLIKQVRLQDGEALQDVAIKEGKKSLKSPQLLLAMPKKSSKQMVVFLIPGFVESHLHLDKALIADRKPNKSGTLKEAIEVTAELKTNIYRRRHLRPCQTCFRNVNRSWDHGVKNACRI